MDAAEELLELAREKFGKLKEAEEKLFRAAAKGEIADYSPRSKKPIDPVNAAKWGPTRVLHANRIAWLCTEAAQLVTHRGIRIKGARIDDKFDLLFAKVPFHLLFEKCKFMADINFQEAQIVALYMPGTHTGPLSADGMKTDGPVCLRNDFKAEGEVRLLGAMVGGDLDCKDGHLINKNGIALNAADLKVDGGVFLRDGFKAEGAVDLRGATVCGSLACDNSQFINKGGDALSADGLKVEGRASLRNGFKAEGTVSFVGATIRGSFYLTDIDSPEEMTLDLASAKVGTLGDEQDGWPESGRLLLHGLEYKEIFDESPRDAKTRIEWLRRQDGFWPQTYEQLAKVLRESGDSAGARDVLVAKNKDKAKRSKTKLTFTEKCWYWFFGPLIGYGHKPWLAIHLALVIILFGSIFFKEGYSHGLITPLSDSAYTSEGDSGILAPGDTNRRISEVYPVFNSLVYSIDVFIPVVDLRQAKYWLPNANRGPELVPTNSVALCTGGLLLGWLWLETACGWVLTTLFLVGLTGLVRT